jgi:dihydrofolate synthase/folylpolyglutamate synthase
MLDGAHNPEGMAALVESLPDVAGGRKPLVAVVSILDDKDAAAMLRVLLPLCDALICTTSHNPRALPPPTLESLARQLNGPPAEIVRGPGAALARAREMARRGGAVLATGSIYLVADLLGAEALAHASTL